MRRVVSVITIVLIAVAAVLAWRLKRPPPVASTAISQKPAAAPNFGAVELLTKLQVFARAIPQSLLVARREANPDVARQKWKIEVARLDIENSPSALHPLQGVIAVREILNDPKIFYSDHVLLRLSFDGSKWNLDQAMSEESSGLIGDQPGPRHTVDVTDWPPLARAIQLANSQ